MAHNVSVRTVASASQIAQRTGLEPTSSRAVMGSGVFFHVFSDVEADDAVAYVHGALAPLGELVPLHAVELEPSLL